MILNLNCILNDQSCISNTEDSTQIGLIVSPLLNFGFIVPLRKHVFAVIHALINVF